MRPILLVLPICFLIFSCKKNDTPHLAVPSSEYFPNSIGNYWKYKYVDSILNKSEFVEVNIIGNTVLYNGQNAKIWTYTYPDHIDTNFVYQVGNTISFVNAGLNVYVTYVVPFSLNNKWRTSPAFLHDSISVTENRAYYLNGQKFDSSFLLQEDVFIPNEFWSSVKWFAPNIGMITNTIKGLYTLANEYTNICWELVDYKLK